MFPKTKNRIFFSIAFLSSFFLLFFTIICSIYINDFIKSDYHEKAKDNITLETANFNIQYRIFESNFLTLSNNSLIINYVKKGIEVSNTLAYLNSLHDSSEMILGTTLYGVSSVSSNNVSNVPSLQSLLSLPSLNEFANDQQKIVLLNIRNNYIPGSYGFTPYDSDYGILSCFVKIFDPINNDLYGYLVVDFSSEFIYNYHFNFRSYQYFNNSNCLIISDNVYLKTNNNIIFDEYKSLRSNNVKRHGKYDYISTTINNDYDITLIIFNPHSNIAFYQYLIIFLAILANIIGFTITFVSARFFARAINKRMEKLYLKMNDENLRIHGQQ